MILFDIIDNKCMSCHEKSPPTLQAIKSCSLQLKCMIVELEQS